ncbi:Adenylate kinase isoenzyme 6 [Galdieria sulphuraria]|uniref:Adenylate kinase isoenzyme 6 homolog n=1 Tax=Galdieria sulphuraria TaxID=130081 RepID=M2XYJ8_GALSU|nr:transcription initiation factor TFIID subunit D7 [Galdieria sulphuraria]EME28544.1 transcription initiation factor TFIID subunit D7 [Galdieria sulphuraria]GJD08500.1 Adenylate kinase isoenzyme 6 [Galdieria sulphuraria]|eukprot:XP_005705064.1 transcription initiation factor TFIID subunit D7 [Galdieria sulphuraria]
MTELNNTLDSSQLSLPKYRKNILLVGTPGTGKTSLAKRLTEVTSLEHVEVGKFAEEHSCLGSYDEQLECFEIEEEKLIPILIDFLKPGGYLLEYHGCEWFASCKIDLVIVLQTETAPLYDRLKARGYSGRKLEENMECEIMQVILDEAYCCFNEKQIWVVPSNKEQDLEETVERVQKFLESSN